MRRGVVRISDNGLLARDGMGRFGGSAATPYRSESMLLVDGPCHCRHASLFCLPPSDFCRALNTKRRDSPAVGGDGESILITLAESARNRVCRDFHNVRLVRLAESCRDD